MKNVTYIGGCSTICEFGQKFTLHRRTILVSDEDVKPFLNNPCYAIIDVPEEKILDSEKEQNETDEEDLNSKSEEVDEQLLANKKKLMNLSAEQLKIMCEDKGLDSNGTKDVLSDRILGL